MARGNLLQATQAPLSAPGTEAREGRDTKRSAGARFTRARRPRGRGAPEADSLKPYFPGSIRSESRVKMAISPSKTLVACLGGAKRR